MHDCAQRALALSQSVGDETGQALALRVLVFSLYQMGRLEEAGDLNARALAAMRTLGNKAEAAACLNHRRRFSLARGDVAAARESCAQALAARKALGDETGQLWCWEISRSWRSTRVRLSRHYAWRARHWRSTCGGKMRRC